MLARDTQSLEWDTEWDLWLSGSITFSSVQTVWPGAILCKTGICLSCTTKWLAVFFRAQSPHEFRSVPGEGGRLGAPPGAMHLC